MNFDNNPDYKLAYEKDGIKLYVPASADKYHTHRYIAAGQHEIYANSGCTKDILEHYMKAGIELLNADKPVKTLRTDLAVIFNSVLARTKFPVDEDAAIRMGAILTFMEDEDPNTVSEVWIQRKIDLAKGNNLPKGHKDYLAPNPDLYAFFLTMGESALPVYRELLNTTDASDYYRQRRQTLEQLRLSVL